MDYLLRSSRWRAATRTPVARQSTHIRETPRRRPVRLACERLVLFLLTGAPSPGSCRACLPQATERPGGRAGARVDGTSVTPWVARRRGSVEPPARACPIASRIQPKGLGFRLGRQASRGRHRQDRSGPVMPGAPPEKEARVRLSQAGRGGVCWRRRERSRGRSGTRCDPSGATRAWPGSLGHRQPLQTGRVHTGRGRLR
jgi:hypothetical protein